MVTCAVTTSFLGCLVTTCLYFRYTLCLNIGLLPRLLLFVPFLVAGCVPLLVSYRLENVFGSFYPFYRYGLYWLYNPLYGNADCRRFVLAVKLYAAADEIFLLLPMAELGNFGLVPAVCGRGAVCRCQSTRGKECSYFFRKADSRIYGCCFERSAYSSRD